MNILVTGAAGFIGGALVEYFRGMGAKVFVDAERGHSGSTTRWPMTAAALGQAMSGVVPDVIFHAAGSGTVAKVAAQPSLELPANLGAFLAVLQYVRLQAPQARVVLLSSAALYGNAPATPQREADIRAPVSLYGVAKAQAEQLAVFYAEQLGVSTTAVRLFSVYGPGLRKQLLWDAMNKFAQGKNHFFGTGREQRDWVHMADVCRFMDCLLARPPGVRFEVYNCAGGQPASTGEVLSILAHLAGAAAPIFDGQLRAGDPTALVADCSLAQRVLGWHPQVPWRDGVAEYARWFATQAREPQPGRAHGAAP
jgi:UDP-glucose 4-epimerase